MVAGERNIGQGPTGEWGPPPEWWAKQTEVEGRMTAVEKDVKSALDAAREASLASTQASNRVSEVANLIQTHVQVDDERRIRDDDERRRTRRRVEIIEVDRQEEAKTAKNDTKVAKASWVNIVVGVSVPVGLAILAWMANTLLQVNALMQSVNLPKP